MGTEKVFNARNEYVALGLTGQWKPIFTIGLWIFTAIVWPLTGRLLPLIRRQLQTTRRHELTRNE